MEPLLIATIALGAVLLLTLLLWFRTGRRRRRAERAAAHHASELETMTERAESLRLGEQEAAWAADAAARRMQQAMVDLDKADSELDRLRGDLDEMSERLGSSSAELERLRSDLTAAEARAAETAGQAEVVSGLEHRLETVTRERDRLAAVQRHNEELATELAALGRVQADVQALQEQNEALRQQIESSEPNRREELEAHIADLERQLDAAQDAPVEASGAYAGWEQELRRRVDAAVERATSHLTAEVAHLRQVVAEKERIIQQRLKSAAPGRPAPILTDIKGIGPKIAAILVEQGITSVAEVARLDDAGIERLGESMPVYPGRIRDDDWVGQAQALLA